MPSSNAMNNWPEPSQQQRAGQESKPTAFPTRKISSNTPQQAFISQQLSELAMKKQQQNQRFPDSHFAASGMNSIGSSQNINNSGGLITNSGNGQLKRSTLEEAAGSYLNEGTKFRQLTNGQTGNTMVLSSANQANQPTSAYPGSNGSNTLYSATEPHRSFKGTGNQIAAVSSPPFINKAGHGSTMGLQMNSQGPN